MIRNNQLKIMSTLAQVLASVEVLTNKVIAIERLLQTETNIPLADLPFKAIASKEELDILEGELKNDSKIKRCVGKLSTVCGTSGKLSGLDCAYRLIDYVMTREMVHKCSWTGMKRDATDAANQPTTSSTPEHILSKIPLKFYVKFRELFLTVVRLADNDFSETSCEKFLKGVMKNSKQRLIPKVISTHKNRPKPLVYAAKQDNSSLDK